MRTYPAHLAKTLRVDGGAQVIIRPIRAADAQIEQDFVRGLSDEARYNRFLDMLRELSPSMLKQLTQIDYHDHMAFIAVIPANGHEIEIAVGRYVVMPDGESCEFAIVVADDWQGKGIATAVMHALMDSARRRGLKTMIGEVLTSNSRMLHFVARLGFSHHMDPRDPTLTRVEKAL